MAESGEGDPGFSAALDRALELALQAENASSHRRNGGDAVSVQASERAVLAYFLARWQALDADIIIGHNIGPWDLTMLLQRLQHHKVPHFSRVGRLKRQRLPSLSGGGNMYGGGASPVRAWPSWNACAAACARHACKLARPRSYVHPVHALCPTA
jgi:DNA polymerase elongation subunit (family B)